MSTAGGQEPVADVATELRALVDVAIDRLDPWLRSASDPVAGASSRTPAGACTWCPLCALVSALRGDHPELARRLAEQGGEVLAVLRTALDDHAGGSDPHPPGAHAPEPGPTVQRVTVRRAPVPR